MIHTALNHYNSVQDSNKPLSVETETVHLITVNPSCSTKCIGPPLKGTFYIVYHTCLRPSYANWDDLVLWTHTWGWSAMSQMYKSCLWNTFWKFIPYVWDMVLYCERLVLSAWHKNPQAIRNNYRHFEAFVLWLKIIIESQLVYNWRTQTSISATFKCLFWGSTLSAPRRSFHRQGGADTAACLEKYLPVHASLGPPISLDLISITLMVGSNHTTSNQYVIHGCHGD